MFIRIVLLLIVFVLSDNAHSFAHQITQKPIQQQSHPQLSGPDFTAFCLPDHALNIDQYFLDSENADLKEVKSDLQLAAHTTVLLLLINHLFAESVAIPLNQLREKEIAASYATPRYILHHNLRIPSC